MTTLLLFCLFYQYLSMQFCGDGMVMLIVWRTSAVLLTTAIHVVRRPSVAFTTAVEQSEYQCKDRRKKGFFFPFFSLFAV